MPLVLLCWLLLAYIVGTSRGSPITFEINSNSEECFHYDNESTNGTIRYYYAVQYAYNNDLRIDYTIARPNNSIFVRRHKVRQGEYSFIAGEIGEYSFCFKNLGEYKIVDFNIGKEETSQVRLKPQEPDDKYSLQYIVHHNLEKLELQVAKTEKNLQYYKVRSLRNNNTISSIADRVGIISLIGMISALMAGHLQMELFKWVINRHNDKKYNF